MELDLSTTFRDCSENAETRSDAEPLIVLDADGTGLTFAVHTRVGGKKLGEVAVELFEGRVNVRVKPADAPGTMFTLHDFNADKES